MWRTGSGSPASPVEMGSSGGVYMGEGSLAMPSAGTELISSGEVGPVFGSDDADVTWLLASDTHEREAPPVNIASEDYSRAFFNTLLTPDPARQQVAATSICNALRHSLSMEPHSLLRTHLPFVVKLAEQAPFTPIRTTFADFLEEIKDRLPQLNITMPRNLSPSRFIPRLDIIPINTDKPETQDNFRSIFLQFGRVSNLNRLLAYHIPYVDVFIPLMDTIMRTPQGPLTRPWRHYIAIMAAAEYSCDYIVEEQEREFLDAKGDPTWLNGFHFAPKKLQNLNYLNNYLAFRPWLVRKEHIEALVKGDDAWSAQELVQAIVILASYHSLAALCHAVGVNPEVDSTNDLQMHTADEPDHNPGSAHGSFSADDTLTRDLLTKFQQTQANPSPSGATPGRMDISGRVEVFVAAERSSPGQSDSLEHWQTPESGYLSKKYVTEYPGKRTYVDFDMKENEIYHFSDYGWGTQAFPLLKRYYPVAAESLDHCFAVTREMTYKSFAGQSADTTLLRQAVWHYVHRVCGIFHDDYDYRDVNQMLVQPIKIFIKKISTNPVAISKHDLQLEVKFASSEKVHIALLTIESRKQAELLYAFRALAKHLSSR